MHRAKPLFVNISPGPKFADSVIMMGGGDHTCDFDDDGDDDDNDGGDSDIDNDDLGDDGGVG